MKSPESADGPPVGSNVLAFPLLDVRLVALVIENEGFSGFWSFGSAGFTVFQRWAGNMAGGDLVRERFQLIRDSKNVA